MVLSPVVTAQIYSEVPPSRATSNKNRLLKFLKKFVENVREDEPYYDKYLCVQACDGCFDNSNQNASADCGEACVCSNMCETQTILRIYRKYGTLCLIQKYIEKFFE
ncbi:unnamed protein product [Didymodactylos carnosus]|nr:unnamed protein product [Didymodactylos carnosus]CAF4317519.1 unnamed protein product [Didymodactylos carnosus]